MESILLLLILIRLSYAAYEPTWESLDSRPLPGWYDEAKIGIFLHWGVYSVPAFRNEWFWTYMKDSNDDAYQYMKNNYRPGFTYQEFAPQFTAKFFKPDDWAQLFVDSGAKYVVLTSKHHEGYTLWPSSYSYSWNSVDVGSHRDLLGELSEAVRNAGLRMGYYYSLLEWYNPMYMADRQTGFETTIFTDNKIQPELRELVTKYKPDIVWADGERPANYTYWKSREFLAWLYNDSPVKDYVVANDRWGFNILCQHGDFYTCVDRYNPGVLQPHKWENAMTIDQRSWGYRENANLEEIITSYDLIVTLAQTVSCGGNILINVGPTKEGMIVPIFQERLRDLGSWLNINGEAIYSSKPWKVQNDTLGRTWYTSKEDAVYAIALDWPREGTYDLGSVAELFGSELTVVEILGYGKVTWSIYFDLVSVTFPDRSMVVGNWAWVLKITNYQTSTTLISPTSTESTLTVATTTAAISTSVTSTVASSTVTAATTRSTTSVPTQ